MFLYILISDGAKQAVLVERRHCSSTPAPPTSFASKTNVYGRPFHLPGIRLACETAVCNGKVARPQPITSAVGSISVVRLKGTWGVLRLWWGEPVQSIILQTVRGLDLPFRSRKEARRSATYHVYLQHFDTIHPTPPWIFQNPRIGIKCRDCLDIQSVRNGQRTTRGHPSGVLLARKFL
jgi:hypothetical protein